MLTILDHFLFLLFFYTFFLPYVLFLPCSPPLLLQQTLKTPSVTALSSSLCRAWRRISPGTSRQPDSQLGAPFSPCLHQTQLAQLDSQSCFSFRIRRRLRLLPACPVSVLWLSQQDTCSPTSKSCRGGPLGSWELHFASLFFHPKPLKLYCLL